jgi:predicted RNA binding protein YcfA (HicA-like mRNA interferase family)
LKHISGKRMVQVLKKHGWTVQRIHGSHHYMTKPGASASISVPVHGNTTLKAGLQRDLMKKAGLKDEDL